MVSSNHFPPSVNICDWLNVLVTRKAAVSLDLKMRLKMHEIRNFYFIFKSDLIGYLNNQKASELSIDQDGWLHTGDIGYHDDNEHLFIVDKLKDLIKFRGHQVSLNFG